jgi:tetratricopeptide (TPR) repeat protein
MGLDWSEALESIVRREQEKVAEKERQAQYYEIIEQGLEAVRAQDYPEAVRIFQEAENFNPRGETAYMLEGEIWSHFDQNIQAIHCYKTAFNLNPRNLSAAAALWGLLTRAGNYLEALDIFHRLSMPNLEIEEKEPMMPVPKPVVFHPC